MKEKCNHAEKKYGSHFFSREQKRKKSFDTKLIKLCTINFTNDECKYAIYIKQQ